ncbi:hypothetical protein DL765_003559 [Monosporascus sp. GIB2]|nr:hypothetical protein DL765_003559 [Monosporascus sp. GIB2]
MAAKGSPVVLLNGADMLMVERNPHDIAGNELVSAFLRELEYTRPIIFLATNMYRTINTAFRSRISLHQLLESDPGVLIWPKFLDKFLGRRFAPASRIHPKLERQRANPKPSTLPRLIFIN